MGAPAMSNRTAKRPVQVQSSSRGIPAHIKDLIFGGDIWEAIAEGEAKLRGTWDPDVERVRQMFKEREAAGENIRPSEWQALASKNPNPQGVLEGLGKSAASTAAINLIMRALAARRAMGLAGSVAGGATAGAGAGALAGGVGAVPGGLLGAGGGALAYLLGRVAENYLVPASADYGPAMDVAGAFGIGQVAKTGVKTAQKIAPKSIAAKKARLLQMKYLPGIGDQGILAPLGFGRNIAPERMNEARELTQQIRKRQPIRRGGPPTEPAGFGPRSLRSAIQDTPENANRVLGAKGEIVPPQAVTPPPPARPTDPYGFDPTRTVDQLLAMHRGQVAPSPFRPIAPSAPPPPSALPPSYRMPIDYSTVGLIPQGGSVAQGRADAVPRRIKILAMGEEDMLPPPPTIKETIARAEAAEQAGRTATKRRGKLVKKQQYTPDPADTGDLPPGAAKSTAQAKQRITLEPKALPTEQQQHVYVKTEGGELPGRLTHVYTHPDGTKAWRVSFGGGKSGVFRKDVMRKISPEEVDTIRKSRTAQPKPAAEQRKPLRTRTKSEKKGPPKPKLESEDPTLYPIGETVRFLTKNPKTKGNMVAKGVVIQHGEPVKVKQKKGSRPRMHVKTGPPVEGAREGLASILTTENVSRVTEPSYLIRMEDGTERWVPEGRLWYKGRKNPKNPTMDPDWRQSRHGIPKQTKAKGFSEGYAQERADLESWDTRSSERLAGTLGTQLEDARGAFKQLLREHRKAKKTDPKLAKELRKEIVSLLQESRRGEQEIARLPKKVARMTRNWSPVKEAQIELQYAYKMLKDIPRWIYPSSKSAAVPNPSYEHALEKLARARRKLAEAKARKVKK